MAKYLLLKHYRGGPAPVVDIDPMDQWATGGGRRARPVDARLRDQAWRSRASS